MIHEISKQFSFCYGHRVWTQELDPELSLNCPCACRHIHGHQGEIILHFQGGRLNDQGMVFDFKNLEWFKKFIDDTFDHKFIMDCNDPLFENEVPDDLQIIFNTQNIGSLNLGYLGNLNLKYGSIVKTVIEKYEGMVFTKFVPTSENLCKFFYDIVRQRMDKFFDKNFITFKGVTLYETPKSKAYYGE